jgi:glyoxylate reductase
LFKILITQGIPSKGIEILKSKGYTLVENRDGKPLDRRRLKEMAKGVNGILCTLHDNIDKEIIDSCGGSLKIISTFSTGYEHVDKEEAKRRGISIGYTGDILTQATADLTMGLIICMARRIVEADKYVRRSRWKTGWSPTLMLGFDLYNKTLGIIGIGRIGQALATRATGFNLRILANSRSNRKDNIDLGLRKKIEMVSIERLLSESDYIALCCPLNRESYHLIDINKIKMMKKTCFLINTARGKIIKEKDLIFSLKSNIIAGAALDVFEKEPIPKTSPLLKMNNVILQPHIGSATIETRNNMSKIAAENIVNVLEGKPEKAILVE